MQTSDLFIHAEDNYALRATLFCPDNAIDTIATVVINSGVGIRRQFYSRFAKFLAQNGFAVLTYDYRGMAESRPENLRKFGATIRDWPQLDTPAAIEYLKKKWPSKNLYLIGHSMGGNILGLVANLEKVDAALFVCAQFGYWKLWPKHLRALMAFNFYVTVPFTSAVFGYVPRWLGAGQHWPRGIALELAKWCRHPRYLFGDKSLDSSAYATFEGPILAYSFTDDALASKAACDALLLRFPVADVEHRHLSPDSLNLAQIGHYGFFMGKCEPLWKECGEWITVKANRTIGRNVASI